MPKDWNAQQVCGVAPIASMGLQCSIVVGTAGVMRRLMRVDLGFPKGFAKCELMAVVQFPVVDSFPSLTATALIC
jgi:hypothetical protein